LALGLAEDPSPRRRALGAPPAAAVARTQRGQALAVEACDQRGDGIPGLAAGGAGGLLVIGAVGDQQQHLGAADLGGGSGLGPAQLSQEVALLVAERPERVFLAAGHASAPPGVAVIANAQIMATHKPSDPLVVSQSSFDR